MNESNKLVNFTFILLSLAISIYLLVLAKDFLVPLVIAIFIWNLINIIAETITHIKYVGRFIPNSLAMILAVFILAFLIWIIVDIISNNVNEIIAALPRYQKALLELANTVDHTFHINSLVKLSEVIKGTNIQTLLTEIYVIGTSISSSLIVVILYIIFLCFEQRVFRAKISAIFPSEDHRYLTLNIFSHIINDIQKYLGIKTFGNLIIALISWIIMKFFGLDFAAFWALLIFFLNYIPNIGAIIALVFPTILAFIQFHNWSTSTILISSLAIVDAIVGNILEPRLMGNSLNLSPLVILFALAIWELLWGFVGLFLAVPMTVVIMVVCSRFKKTRPIAVLLSENGKLQSYD